MYVVFQINDSQLNSSESGRVWVCLPIVLRALSIFRLLLFLLEYPAGVSAEERALERFQRDPAGYPNNNSNNRKIESARRTIGSDAKVRRRRSFRTAVWAKHVHTSNVAMLDLPPGPTDILCENLGFQASLRQGQVHVFAFAVSFCFCLEVFTFAVSFCFYREVFAFSVRYLLLLWVFAFAVKYLVLPWGRGFCREVFGFSRCEVFCFCREAFSFAVRFLVFPWGILFLPWDLWLCREGFGFAVTVVSHRKN